MATCSVRWRPSGGRGEFEFVPADTLLDREISVYFDALRVTIQAEVRGVHAQGKPRLRKFEGNNRLKLHLPQLVMAVSALPEPAREDLLQNVVFPLENKCFVIEKMDFDIIDDDGLTVLLSPLRVSVRHSDFEVDLPDRLNALASDLESLVALRATNRELADAVEEHATEVAQRTNTIRLRQTADRLIEVKTMIFGKTNAASALALTRAEAKPETDLEEPAGREGKLLTRIHAYKERDRAFAKRVREYYRQKNKGYLSCEACGMMPNQVYGAQGESCMEAHHKVPIEQLQPDSVTLVNEMAVVCANCHRIIHSNKPCLTIQEVRCLLRQYGTSSG